MQKASIFWCFLHSLCEHKKLNLCKKIASVQELVILCNELKVLHDPWRTWIINQDSWFYFSILHYFEMQVLQMVRVVYAELLRYVSICNT